MSRISNPDKEEIKVTFHRGNVCMPHPEIMHDAQAAVQSEIRNPSEFIHVLYLYRSPISPVSSISFPESLLQNLSELHWLTFLPWSAKRQVATGKTRDIISFAHLSSQNLEVEPWKKRKKKKRISLFLTNFSAPRKHRSNKPFEDCHPPDPNKRNYVVRVLGLMHRSPFIYLHRAWVRGPVGSVRLIRLIAAVSTNCNWHKFNGMTCFIAAAST